MKEKSVGESPFGAFVRPQGAPRGLLAFYILHSISQKPAHGYEILQDIEGKTEGAWRPGAGSIYPILKKFFSQGYIKSSCPKRRLPTAQRVYEVTSKGEKYLKQMNEKFNEAGKNWGSMRRIFIEFMKPDHIDKFLIEGTQVQFDMWQEVFESKTKHLVLADVEYILKEYALMLERQSDWVSRKLRQTTTRQAPVMEASR